MRNWKEIPQIIFTMDPEKAEARTGSVQYRIGRVAIDLNEVVTYGECEDLQMPEINSKLDIRGCDPIYTTIEYDQISKMMTQKSIEDEISAM